MPPPLLNAYAEQLPRLTAEESLQAAERTAVGSGALKKGKGKQIADRWRRQAGQRAHVLRPATREQYAAQMAGLGIGVKIAAPAPSIDVRDSEPH